MNTSQLATSPAGTSLSVKTTPEESPSRAGVDVARLPFFTLFQVHFVCQCATRHISKGGKFSLRIISSKTAKDNIMLIRHMFDLDAGDTIVFEDLKSNTLVPDYDALGRGEKGRPVRVMVFIKRENAELNDRLAKDNGTRGFNILEDACKKGWEYGEEDKTTDIEKRCPCNECMLRREQEMFREHLEQHAAANDFYEDSSISSESEDEAMEDDDVLGVDRTFTVRTQDMSNGGNDRMRSDDGMAVLEVVTDPSAVGASSSPPPHEAEMEDATTYEGQLHYGRIFPIPTSSGVPDSWGRLNTERRGNKVPTDEEFRTAATNLRWMR
jgi:hypothetical protein